MKLVYLPANKSGVVASYGSDTMPTTFIADQGRRAARASGFEERDASGELKKMRDAFTKLVK